MMGGLIAEWASRLFLFFCWRGSCELVILFLCCTVQYGTLPFAKSLLKEKYCGKAPEATDVLIQVV